jgi:recombination protein RecA
MAKRSPAAPSAAAHAASTADMLTSMQAEMNDMFDEDVAGILSSASTLSQIDQWVSTRSMVVDKVIAGGRPTPCSLVPFGRQTEISGLPGTGKTTLCAQIAAEVQAKGGFVVVTDTEERIDHPYWRKLGVDTDKILNLRANTLEQVFERQYVFIEKANEKWPGVPILMLWDSLGGTSTDSIMDDTDAKGAKKKDSIMERAKKAMMVKAKLISAGMEIINPAVAHSKVAYVYTNTLYQKPDIDYGDPWETPGGNKKNFFATLRLRIKVTSHIKEEDENTGKVSTIGQWVEVAALKNSMAPMKVSLPAAIIGGRGYSDDYSVWKLGTGLGVIVRPKGSAWSTWAAPSGDEVKFQGFDGFVEKVAAHSEYALLVQQVSEAL